MNTKALRELNKLLILYGNAQFDCGVYGLRVVRDDAEPDIDKPSSVAYEKLCAKTRRLKEEIIELFKGGCVKW